MDKVLSEIKRIQLRLAEKTNRFGDYGLDERDADELLDVLNDSVSINRVLYMRVKELEGAEL